MQYTVHGQRGSDPTEPYSPSQYLYPPISHELYVSEFARKLSIRGYSPFPLPIGVRLNEQDPINSECIRCGTCDSYPCMINAKSDAYTSALKQALQYPNVHLATNTYVERLEVSTSGRTVSKVIATTPEGVTELYADIIVVACGAVNSAALLLKSTSDKQPNGIGNNNDLVGRHYMGHGNSTWILAVSTIPNTTKFPKTLAIHDYYFGDESFPYPMGAIQTVGRVTGTILQTKAPKFVPEQLLNSIAHYSIALSVTSEDLPLSENRVLITRDGKIQLRYQQHNRTGHERLVAKLLHSLRDMGYYCLTYQLNIGDVAHQCGTMRFGLCPESSVLDTYCKVHGIDNLYVVDSSFFVSSAAVNPALTVIANAKRVGDHLIDRMK